MKTAKAQAALTKLSNAFDGQTGEIAMAARLAVQLADEALRWREAAKKCLEAAEQARDYYPAGTPEHHAANTVVMMVRQWFARGWFARDK